MLVQNTGFDTAVAAGNAVPNIIHRKFTVKGFISQLIQPFFRFAAGAHETEPPETPHITVIQTAFIETHDHVAMPVFLKIIIKSDQLTGHTQVKKDLFSAFKAENKVLAAAIHPDDGMIPEKRTKGLCRDAVKDIVVADINGTDSFMDDLLFNTAAYRFHFRQFRHSGSPYIFSI